VSYNLNVLVLACAVMFGLSACVSAPPQLIVAEEEWVYEVRAINMAIQAASDVNSVSGRPHSIAIGIFQMNDPNTFSALAVDQAGPEGAFELLQKGRIDDSIVNFQLISMRPGEQKKISISRAQTAKYIGVIAGYFKLNPKTDVKIFKIPARPVKRGIVEKVLAVTTLISDEAKALPDKLSIFVDLGRTGSKQIVTIGVNDGDGANKQKAKEKSAKQSWFGTLKKDISNTSQATDLVE
jgi:type VI secretion system VasD/TssJ family lipoprotein